LQFWSFGGAVSQRDDGSAFGEAKFIHSRSDHADAAPVNRSDVFWGCRVRDTTDNSCDRPVSSVIKGFRKMSEESWRPNGGSVLGIDAQLGQRPFTSGMCWGFGGNRWRSNRGERKSEA
jgi:hypothetical protein